MNSDPPSRILVRSPNWVGDVVMATPAIRALRLQFPRAHLAVFVKSYVRQLLEHSPHINEIVEYDPEGLHQGVSGYYVLLRQLRKRRFDLGVLFPNSFRSAWEMRVIGVRRRAGYVRQGRGWLLTDPVEPPREGRRLKIVNMVDYYLKLCEHLGCTHLERKEELFPSEQGESQAEQVFKENGVAAGEMVLALAPGAGYGPSKLYPLERYAQALDSLAGKYRCRALLILSPKESALGDTLAAQMRHAPIRVNPLSLDLLKSLIKRCALLITNDTGPRHLAVALGKPVVVLMGPTSSLYTDVNLEKTLIVREPVECSPCQLKVCPIDHRCMTRISPDRVLHAAETLIERHVLD